MWPSGLSTRVTRIVTWDGELDVAVAPMSVTVVLADDIDVSRGDVLAQGPIEVSRRFSASVVWMDERPLDPSRAYILKHASRVVTVDVDRSLNRERKTDLSRSLPLDPVFDSDPTIPARWAAS